MAQREKEKLKQSLTRGFHVRFEKLAALPLRQRVISFVLITHLRSARKVSLMAAAEKAIMCAPSATATIAWPITRNHD